MEPTLTPTITLILAGLVVGMGLLIGWLFARQQKAPPLAQTTTAGDVLRAMNENMRGLAAEIKEARAEARANRLDLATAQREWDIERAGLQQQINDLRRAVNDGDSYVAALMRAIQAEADSGAAILARIPDAFKPRAKQTGPLGAGSFVRTVLKTQAQAPLLGMLLNATWVTGTKEGRTVLLRDLPPEFVATVERADDAKTDLVVMIDRAVMWPVVAGERSLLSDLLDTAGSLIPDSTQVHADLLAWRDQWKL